MTAIAADGATRDLATARLPGSTVGGGFVVDSIWDMTDFHPSEEERLGELVGQATTALRVEVRPRLVAALEKAAPTFAREHPAAPRK
jgi:hypothetical protein